MLCARRDGWLFLASWLPAACCYGTQLEADLRSWPPPRFRSCRRRLSAPQPAQLGTASLAAFEYVAPPPLRGMPPKWKGGPGRDWSTCECRNCRWLWLDAVPSDVPELRDTVAWAAGSPFGANRLDRKHKQLHLLLPCTRLQKETPAPQRGASGSSTGGDQ